MQTITQATTTEVRTRVIGNMTCEFTPAPKSGRNLFGSCLKSLKVIHTAGGGILFHFDGKLFSNLLSAEELKNVVRILESLI